MEIPRESSEKREEKRIERLTELTGDTILRLSKEGPTLAIYQDKTSQTGYIMKGPFEGLVIEMPMGSFTVGRAGDIKIIDPSNTVSREHLSMSNDGEVYSIVDISTNGTFLVE